MTRFIAIISGEKGVGKTTTALNLGTALVPYRKTVVLDANFIKPELDVHLNARGLPVTLANVLSRENTIDEGIYTHDSGLKIIPGDITGEINQEQFNNIIDELNGYAEIVLMDTHHDFENNNHIIKNADESIIVLNPNPESLYDSLKALEFAQKNKITVLGIILNQAKNRESTKKWVETITKIPVIGVIPDHNKIKQSFSKGHPVVYLYPNSKPSLEFRKLAYMIA